MTKLMEYLPHELQSEIRTYTPHPLSLVYYTGIITNGWYNIAESVNCIKPSKPGICIDQIAWEDDDWWRDEEIEWEDEESEWENNPSYTYTPFEYDFWMNNKKFYRKHLKDFL